MPKGLQQRKWKRWGNDGGAHCTSLKRIHFKSHIFMPIGLNAISNKYKEKEENTLAVLEAWMYTIRLFRSLNRLFKCIMNTNWKYSLVRYSRVMPFSIYPIEHFIRMQCTSTTLTSFSPWLECTFICIQFKRVPWALWNWNMIWLIAKFKIICNRI